MPLIQLLTRCAKFGGDNIADRGSKISLLADVNSAAKCIWDECCLPGSIREETICSDITEGLQTLPWYMYKIQGCKIHSTRQMITVLDEHQYYQTHAFFQSPYTIRVKAAAAIKTQLTAASKLTVSIPVVEAEKFTVTIVGSAAQGAAVSETLTFNPGELTKTTATLFTPVGNNPISLAVTSITRDKLTTSDTVITDQNSTLLAIIPARQYSSRYLVFQLYDQLRFVIDQGYDVLFKLPFPNLVNDSDILLDGLFDEAIYWRFVGNRMALKTGDETAIAQASAAMQESMTRVSAILTAAEANVESKIDFGENRYNDMIKNPFPTNRGFGPYNDLFGYGNR